VQFFDLKFEIAWHRPIGAPPSDTPIAIRAAPLPRVFRLSQQRLLYSHSEKSGSRVIGSLTPVKSRILLNRGGDCRFLVLNSRVLVNRNNEEASLNADERRFD
jgi:hypothetical protein